MAILRHVSSDRLAFLAPSCGLLADKQNTGDEVELKRGNHWICSISRSSTSLRKFNTNSGDNIRFIHSDKDSFSLCHFMRNHMKITSNSPLASLCVHYDWILPNWELLSEWISEEPCDSCKTILRWSKNSKFTLSQRRARETDQSVDKSQWTIALMWPFHRKRRLQQLVKNSWNNHILPVKGATKITPSGM